MKPKWKDLTEEELKIMNEAGLYNYYLLNESNRGSLVMIRDAMITRCYNPNNINYRRYGLRGIKICNEWFFSLNTFHWWAINNGYRKGYTIDRIDFNGNYEPSNCQWLSKSDHSKKTVRDRFSYKYHGFCDYMQGNY